MALGVAACKPSTRTAAATRSIGCLVQGSLKIGGKRVFHFAGNPAVDGNALRL